MGALDEKAQEFNAIFISIQEVLELILQDQDNNNHEHIKNTLNVRFFANQTCLWRDGYDVQVIKIDNASNPSYQTIKHAINDYLDNQNKQSILSDYGFSKKRTLGGLVALGIAIADELIITAKSFVPYCDNTDNLAPYYDCLPEEYNILHESYQQLEHEFKTAKARIATLEKKLGADADELHPRTANNASKIILAMAELLQWDLSEPYADDTNGELRKILEKQGNTLGKDTVAYWFKQAYDIGK